MSTRILGLLTTTAAVSMALSGGVAAASVARNAPPPAPPQANAQSGHPASDPAPDQNAAANAEPKPNTAPQQNSAPEQQAAAPESPPKGRSEAKDGTDLKACEDAECQVEIKDRQTIKFDRKLGMDPLHVRLDGNRVTFSSRGRNGVMVASMDASWPRATTTYNGLTLRPHRAKNGAMILDVSHD
ncbi:pyruvate/2-oxoglutarate dehydrogenase complex dihydrolipoamide acyltransferase (E2) component [Actinomadura coerulea]|uniref:Pyruvate/2-oxoglutarate dehydrogenase complex dihydrolipoamide acyltransferase (E2) component n=1 Tax=Actinomadura coerulea TaxID=46159 RepID=A0A7X0G1P9_9ACTN|nr:hypothetical protein [Actinomadura coerulea]MBB6397671.1 pyruvate/2-oxoglutarate dehydrogenase complex dihydrolipoamide acyltransferase (E2) component [Actinomadura coerulea]GGQ04272.1 hypothetical protein GCM10010187_20410 [Actinomadura coerulea]